MRNYDFIYFEYDKIQRTNNIYIGDTYLDPYTAVLHYESNTITPSYYNWGELHEGQHFTSFCILYYFTRDKKFSYKNADLFSNQFLKMNDSESSFSIRKSKIMAYILKLGFNSKMYEEDILSIINTLDNFESYNENELKKQLKFNINNLKDLIYGIK